MEDRKLVERICNGDTTAFALLIKQTERLVAQIVFKMIRAEEDRKDLAQDIYLKVFRHIRSFNYQSKLSTWIGRIAYNTCCNYLEKKKLPLLEKHITEDETEDDSGNAMEHTGEEVLNKIFRSARAEVLEETLKSLPPAYSTLVLLFHYQELSYEEIMEITQLPAGTIKSYLFRARKVMKEYILQYYKKEDL